MHNEEGKKLRNVYIIIAYTFIVWSIQHTVHDKKPFLVIFKNILSTIYNPSLVMHSIFQKS